jgi:hypothetical protein
MGSAPFLCKADVFEPVGAVLPLREIATLDDLATELFAL